MADYYSTSASWDTSGTTVWSTWNQDFSVTSNTTSTAGWITWNEQWFATGASSTVNSFTVTYTPTQNWNVWNVQWANSTPHGGANQYVIPAMTEEEYARSVEAARVQQEALDQRLQALKEATERAVALLKSLLDEAQRAEYEEKKHFHVVGRSGKRYKIMRGISGNVYYIDPEGRQLKRYCIHPTVSVPEEDNMLAQKLLLETDEEHFLKVANAS